MTPSYTHPKRLRRYTNTIFKMFHKYTTKKSNQKLLSRGLKALFMILSRQRTTVSTLRIKFSAKVLLSFQKNRVQMKRVGGWGELLGGGNSSLNSWLHNPLPGPPESSMMVLRNMTNQDHVRSNFKVLLETNTDTMTVPANWRQVVTKNHKA